MADPVHFDIPFRRRGSSASVSAQGSYGDVVNCIEAVIRTPIGFRPEVPEFGANSLLFQNQPVDIGTLLDQIGRWEPRAFVILTQNPDLYDQLIARIQSLVDVREGG